MDRLLSFLLYKCVRITVPVVPFFVGLTLLYISCMSIWWYQFYVLQIHFGIFWVLFLMFFFKSYVNIMVPVVFWPIWGGPSGWYILFWCVWVCWRHIGRTECTVAHSHYTKKYKPQNQNEPLHASRAVTHEWNRRRKRLHGPCRPPAGILNDFFLPRLEPFSETLLGKMML